MTKLSIDWAGFLSCKATELAEFKKISLEDYCNATEQPINNLPIIKNVPMMLRRRLNNAGKMAVGLTFEAFKSLEYSNDIDKIIYASRVGESLRCINLLNEMVKDNGVSPTEFSSSVHNSNVGVFSIVAKFHGETTAIAAGKDTFYSALIDAYISLKSRGLRRVFIVSYEENLSSDMMDVVDNPIFFGPHALALCVSLPIDDNKNNRDNQRNKEKNNEFNSSVEGLVNVLSSIIIDIDNIKGMSSFKFAHDFL